MYQYAPQSKKIKEKLLVFGILCMAAFSFGISYFPNLWLDSLLRWLAFFLLLPALMLTSRFLLRRYVYRVGKNEYGSEGDPFDFTVIEYFGKRASVVCRVSVEDIESVMHVTPENHKEIVALQKGKRIYDYSAEFMSDRLYLLSVRDEEEVFYIRILADQMLLSLLSKS